MNLVNNNTFNTDNEANGSMRKLVWSCENEDGFRNTLSQEINKYHNLINMLESDNLSINDIMDRFSTLLFEDA